MRAFRKTAWFVITDTFRSRKGHRPVEGMARYWNSTGIRGGGVANTPMESETTKRFIDDAPGQPTTKPVPKPPTG